MTSTKPNIALQNQLVQWINAAGMSEGNKKADLLRKIIEVLLFQGSSMISTYLDNVLSYVNDKSTEVRKIIIGFIEQLSKLHPKYLPKIMNQMQLLINDPVMSVQKKAVQTCTPLYRNSLVWLCKGNAESSEMESVWEQLSKLKILVLNMIDSDNEGIRTQSGKFLECVVLMQTPGEVVNADYQFDDLPWHMPFLNRRKLEEEAEHIFKLLVKFHNSQHISNLNLLSCMTSLCLIGKLRPKLLGGVVQALGDLHTTLPPTLSQTQVNAVRKHLRVQLITLIKHTTAMDMMPHLTQLLLDIGMTAQEINKVIPKEKRMKRLGELKSGDNPPKRIRIDSPQNSQGSDSNSNSRSDFNINDEETSPDSSNKPLKELDITEDMLFDNLTVQNVVALVSNTLVNCLPDEMPNSFMTAYRPISNPGTAAQKRVLAKMLLAFIKDEPEHTQPKLSDIVAKIPLLRDDDEKVTLKNAVAKLQETTKERHIESALSKLMEETRQEHLKAEENKAKEKEKLVPPQTPTIPKLKQKVKLLKLQEITRPIPKETKEKLIHSAVNRILRAEKDSAIGGAAQIRAKFITIFASSYTLDIKDLVLNYIMEDPASRIDLALSWLYEEYAFMQGFNRHPVTLQPKLQEKHDQNYNQLLCALITQICENNEPFMENCKDVLLRKIYTECPMVTDEAIDYLKHLISEMKLALLALDLLEELCIMRPPRAHKYISALVCHVLSENEEIREVSLKSTVKVYQKANSSVRKVIEKHAFLYLGFISLSSPPQEVLDSRHGRMPWTDDLYKMCLNLIIALFTVNEDLIVEVARVYGCASSEAKRVVLRCIEPSIRVLPAVPLRPAFLALLQECPRGSETLLTRVVHILTEKAPPSPELVAMIRELYATKVSDVRFLIPILTGLSKKEILAALPKLIKLNQAVVKEVFNKLLGLQNLHEEISPVSPAELLVALHLIDPSKADLKNIIKATALCFAEKHIFTQDVLSTVLQLLTEEQEIPVLMMRTVLQALTLYPALGPLVLNILQLLIEKEVWLNKVAWEGWLKCCERLLPSSAFLVCSLPASAMPSLSSPAILYALRTHVSGLGQAERALLPSHIVAACHQDAPVSYTPAPVPPPTAVPPPAPVPPPAAIEPLPPGME